MISIVTGLPGSGKSMYISDLMVKLAIRNEKWGKKTGKTRKIWTNIPLSKKIKGSFNGMFEEWMDAEQLPEISDADVVIDEVATYMDAHRWQDMSITLKRWLQQHRKYGVEIYGTAQDFAQCDKSFRRLTSELIYITKLIGSPDLSPTRPPPRRIWGICWIRTLDPQKYEEDKKESVGLPSIFIYGREETEIYDSYAKVESGKYPKLKHIERTCEDPKCRHIKITHT